jgi:transketolase
VLYDANHISIDGSTDLAFTEDVAARFAAYGWHVQTVATATTSTRCSWRWSAAAGRARAPALIRVHTGIGFGSRKKAGTAKAHGAPLGPREVRCHQARARLARGAAVPHPRGGALGVRRRRWSRGQQAHAEWTRRHEAWAKANPELARISRVASPASCRRAGPRRCRRFEAGTSIATRAASGKTINALAASAARAGRRLGRPRGVEPDRRRGGGDFEPATPQGATSASACASTPWAAR